MCRAALERLQEEGAAVGAERDAAVAAATAATEALEGERREATLRAEEVSPHSGVPCWSCHYERGGKEKRDAAVVAALNVQR